MIKETSLSSLIENEAREYFDTNVINLMFQEMLLYLRHQAMVYLQLFMI